MGLEIALAAYRHSIVGHGLNLFAVYTSAMPYWGPSLGHLG